MSTSNEEILSAVRYRLDSIRRKWRMVEGFTWLAIASAVFVGGTAIFVIPEVLFWLPIAVKCAILLILVGGVSFFFIWSLYHFYARLIGKKSPDDIKLARIAGGALPQVKDRLANALQLIENPSLGRERYSGEMKWEALRRAAPVFLKADLSGVVSQRRLKASLKASFAAFLIIPLIFIPSIGGGLSRLFHPLQAFTKPLPFTLEILPGDTVLIEGDTLEISAIPHGKFPAEVAFHILPLEASLHSEEVRIVSAGWDSVFIMEIPAVSRSFQYYARSGKVVSSRHNVEVKIPPKVRLLQVKLNPPEYSRLPVAKLESNIGDILALPGTRAEFNLESGSELESASIIFTSDEMRIDTVELLLRGGNEAVGDMRIMKSGKYHIRLSDREGLTNRYPIEYRLETRPDLNPMVEVVSPGDDLELYGTGALPMLIEGEDDFGLSRMSLIYKVTSEFDIDTSIECSIIPLIFHHDHDGVYRSDFLWELNSLQLIPGDLVEYFVEVWDNDNVNGPKSARSRSYILRLPTMAEMYDAMEQAETAGIEELKETLLQSKEIHEDIIEAIEEIRRKGELDWSEKRNLKEKIDEQEKLLENLERAKESIEDLMQRAEEGSLLSMEILQKYNELQKLMSEICTPEMLKLMEELSKALEEMNPEELRMAAEKFELSQQEFLQRIEKSLEILKQLKLERQLEELALQAEEMAENQKEIADELPAEAKKAAQELAESEDFLQKEMEQWTDKLEETRKLAEERDIQTAQELDSLTNSAESVPPEMGEMSTEIKSGDYRSAKAKGERISKELSQMSQKLGQVKRDMVQRQKNELGKELMNAVRDLITISHQQEDLKEKSERISVRSALFRKQASFQTGIGEALEEVTDRLFQLSQKSFFVSPEIGKSLGRAMSMIESSLNNYTARNPRSVAGMQKNAIGAINKAAVDILDALSQMEGSSSATGYEEMMEKLSQMAGQQGGLNQEMQSMFMPGEGGSGGMSLNQMASMGRMSAQQRALQKAMEELAQQAQQMGGVLGDLGNIADKMGEVADSLEDRNVGERTLKLQERILSRLLDAQKSVRTQRVSRKRQSKVGKEFARRSPGTIPQDTLEEMLRRDILRAMKEGYTVDYQKLIRQYFKALYENK